MDMKRLLLIIIVAVALSGCDERGTPETGYDAELAASLGADDYGMKSYILVILKTGPGLISEKHILDSLFRGHMDNISKLAEEGKLIVAGPLTQNEQQYRGIFIINSTSTEEVEKMMAGDPAISSGVLAVEYYNWYGSAALPKYLETHKRIEKVKP